MIHCKIPVTTAHKRDINLVLASIDYASPADLLDGKFKKRFGLAIGNHLDKNLASSREDTENWKLFPSSAVALSLALAAEIGFIKLYFSLKKRNGIFCVSQDHHPKDRNSSMSCFISNANLLCDRPFRYFEFKELDDPKPLTWAQPLRLTKRLEKS